VVAFPAYGSVHGGLPLVRGNGGSITGAPSFAAGIVPIMGTVSFRAALLSGALSLLFQLIVIWLYANDYCLSEPGPGCGSQLDHHIEEHGRLQVRACAARAGAVN
jgi:hypothetical protein